MSLGLCLHPEPCTRCCKALNPKSYSSNSFPHCEAWTPDVSINGAAFILQLLQLRPQTPSQILSMYVLLGRDEY